MYKTTDFCLDPLQNLLCNLIYYTPKGRRDKTSKVLLSTVTLTHTVQTSHLGKMSTGSQVRRVSDLLVINEVLGPAPSAPPPLVKKSFPRPTPLHSGPRPIPNTNGGIYNDGNVTV